MQKTFFSSRAHADVSDVLYPVQFLKWLNVPNWNCIYGYHGTYPTTEQCLKIKTQYILSKWDISNAYFLVEID